jgi:FkbM family methyltransferase
MAESWNQRLQRGANRLLNPLGLHLVRRERAFEMNSVLSRAAARHTNIGTWIDIGASDGSWSISAQRHFPRAQFLLFEPLAERQAALKQLQQRRGFHIVAAAAGAAPGTIDFAIDLNLDGSGIAAPGATATRSVPVESIDRAVSARRLPPPYGLKLDTHGFEVPVLNGAVEVLQSAALLIIETYNFSLVPGCLRFHELCAHLESHGFRCCDLADPMRRPKDGSFWQMDLAFARTDSPLFSSHTYD